MLGAHSFCENLRQKQVCDDVIWNCVETGRDLESSRLWNICVVDQTYTMLRSKKISRKATSARESHKQSTKTLRRMSHRASWRDDWMISPCEPARDPILSSVDPFISFNSSRHDNNQWDVLLRNIIRSCERRENVSPERRNDLERKEGKMSNKMNERDRAGNTTISERSVGSLGLSFRARFHSAFLSFSSLRDCLICFEVSLLKSVCVETSSWSVWKFQIVLRSRMWKWPFFYCFVSQVFLNKVMTVF